MNYNPYASPKVDPGGLAPAFVTPLFWILNSLLLLVAWLLLRMFVFIPVFRSMYTGIGPQLPLLTRVVISHAFQWGAPIVFMASAVGVNVWRYRSHTRSHKLVILAFLLGVFLFILGIIGTALPGMSM